MSTRFWTDAVHGLDLFEASDGGSFLPQAAGAPTLPKINSAQWWSVKRLAVGRFAVTLKYPPGALIKGIFASLQIDPNGSNQHLDVSVGPVSVINGFTTIELDVTDSTTGLLVDITQPGTLAAQGSMIHWNLRTSGDPFLIVQE